VGGDLARALRVGGVVGFDLLMAVALSVGVVTTLWAGPDLGDLGSFLASGRAEAAGLDPYGSYPLDPGRAYDPNANAPASVLLFHLLAGAEPALVANAWRIVSLALYILCLWLLQHAYPEPGNWRRLIYAVASVGPWATISIGQIYTLLLLAIVAASWLLLRRGRQLAAGVLIGLVVAIKPNFAVWPALLLVAGYGQAALCAGAVALGFSLLPAAVYGPTIYREWLAMVTGDAYRPLHPTNGSLLAVAGRLGAPALGAVATAVLLLGAALFVWGRKLSVLGVSSLALLVSVLASPIIWPGYATFAIPAMFSRRWDGLQYVVGLLLAAPLPVWLVVDLAGNGLSTPYFVTTGLALLAVAVAQDALAAQKMAR